MQAFAIYDPTTDQFLNSRGSKGTLDWCTVPKLYATLDRAKKSFRSVRGAHTWFKPDMTNAVVVEVDFVRGDKTLL